MEWLTIFHFPNPNSWAEPVLLITLLTSVGAHILDLSQLSALPFCSMQRPCRTLGFKPCRTPFCLSTFAFAASWVQDAFFLIQFKCLITDRFFPDHLVPFYYFLPCTLFTSLMPPVTLCNYFTDIFFLLESLPSLIKHTLLEVRDDALQEEPAREDNW